MAAENFSTSILDHLVEQTRNRLESEWIREQPGLTKTFRGYCGLAQCISGYALQDAQIDVRPMATQSLDSYWFGHAALTTRLGYADRLFLLDYTFLQFCVEDRIEGETSPGVHLRQTSEGAELVRDLLDNGYAELTPRKAYLYLAAFCKHGRSPFKTDKQAFAFLADPPSDVYHYRHSEDPNDHAFDRDVLAAKGLLLPPLA